MDTGYDAQTVRERARAWVDGVNSSTGPSGGWRLQVLQLRTRRKFDASGVVPGGALDANGDAVSSTGAQPPSGGCPELPMRIRRFVPGCPWALVDQAVRYLYEIAPYTGIVYNGVKVEGRFRPTLTQWTRDDQQAVAERGANGTYTLVQDLVEVTDCDDALYVASGSSCSAYEETTYRWDESSVEPVPTECEQGVTYSIRAVQRNEDGTFDYQLVKTVARTRHYGPAVVECGPQAVVTEETWESAYGEPGSFEARGCGASGAIPTPACDSVPGVRTQVQYRRNPDCTYDVTVRRRESLEFSDSWRDGTSCRPQDVSVVRNSRSPVAPPAPAPGERVEHTMQRNEDGSYDATTRVVRAPDPYSYSWTDGSSCRRRTVTRLAAQPSMPAVPSAAPGETLDAEVSRNEDCTWDARFSVTSPPDELLLSWREGSACRPVDVELRQASPSAPSVPAPGPGESVSADVSRNADCTYDSRIRVVRPGPQDAVTWRQGSVCRPETVSSWQRVAERPAVPEPGPGQTVRASLSRNDDCTWDANVVVAEAPGGASLSWTEGSACRPAAATAHWSEAAVSIAPPARGETVSASVSRNADCTYDYTERRQRAAQAETFEVVSGSCSRTVTSVVHDNVAAPVSPGPGAPGAVTSASFRRNDDCTYSGTVETAVSTPADLSWTEGGACRTAETHMYFNAPAVSVPAPSGIGETVSASVGRNSDCTYDYRVSRHVAQESSHTVEWDSVEEGPNHRYTYHNALYMFHNLREAPTSFPKGASVSVSMQMNDDCTYSGTISSRKLDKWEQSGSGESGGIGRGSFERKAYAIIDGVRKVKTFRYQTTVYQGSALPSASMLAHHQSVSSGPNRSVVCVDLVDVTEWQ